MRSGECELKRGGRRGNGRAPAAVGDGADGWGPPVSGRGAVKGYRAAAGLRMRGRCRAAAGLARAELVRPAWLFFFVLSPFLFSENFCIF